LCLPASFLLGPFRDARRAMPSWCALRSRRFPLTRAEEHTLTRARPRRARGGGDPSKPARSSTASTASPKLHEAYELPRAGPLKKYPRPEPLTRATTCAEIGHFLDETDSLLDARRASTVEGAPARLEAFSTPVEDAPSKERPETEHSAGRQGRGRGRRRHAQAPVQGPAHGARRHAEHGAPLGRGRGQGRGRGLAHRGRRVPGRARLPGRDGRVPRGPQGPHLGAAGAAGRGRRRRPRERQDAVAAGRGVEPLAVLPRRASR